MGYRVKGTLRLPNGSPASNAEIEFISRKNFSPLVQELKSNIKCSATGAYDVTLEYGEYAVIVYPGGTYPAALGTIILAADTVAGLDLPTLLQQAGWQPATPEYIQQIAAWLADANASAASSAASASAAKVSETSAKSSESAALSSKNSAASSASTATTKAAEAASSASAALASKNAAATSEANALASKSSAATSATTASAGASTATTKASEASASATAAKVSQDAAKVSETNAAASASTAAGVVTTHEGKAGAHPISGVTGLQAALDGKYGPTNKPTAADVGAVNKAGDMMTGNLIMRGSQQHIRFQHTSHNGGDLIWERDNAGVIEQQARLWSSSPTKLHLGAGSETSEGGDGVMTIHASNDVFIGVNRVYTAANKPTAADIQNVVSPVSTGGIIERGSNANGEYVKFADGTMICTFPGLQGYLSNSSNISFVGGSAGSSKSFAAAFSAAPSISSQLTVSSLSVISPAGNMIVGGVTASSIAAAYLLNQAASFGQVDAGNTMLLVTAIGRWK